LHTLLATTDPTIVFAFWLGVGVASLALLMLVIIVILRQVVLHRERVLANAVAYWSRIIVPEPEAEMATIPDLPRRDVGGFLQVWNAVHERLHGATTPHLARVAKEVRLEPLLRRRVGSRNFHTRLVALIAIGHVHDSASFERVQSFIDDKNPIVSLCAARTLMQIDPSRAVSKFIPHIVQRADWSPGSVATILNEVGAEVVAQQLSEVTLQANVQIAPRLIRFLAGVSPEAAAPIIRKTLASSTDERLISTCLQVMTSREDLEYVRPLLAHMRWHVRMQAAVTLGRLGGMGDEQALIAILTDKQWWVRYRAAQALLKMNFIGTEDMRRIQAAQTDSYARDIIQHVLAEQQMGIVTQGA
jgi:hypothetical protein